MIQFMVDGLLGQVWGTSQTNSGDTSDDNKVDDLVMTVEEFQSQLANDRAGNDEDVHSIINDKIQIK